MAKNKRLKKKNKKQGQSRKKLRFLFARIWPIAIRLAVVAVVAMGVLGVRHWLTHSQKFALDKLLVNECEHIQPEKILGYIDARVGANLFTIDLQALHDRLIDHPWIKNVCVTRRLPSTLVVTITEYEPFALINLGRLYYVDEDGFLFKKIEKGDRRDYPILSGFSTNDFLTSEKEAEKYVGRLKTAVDLIDAADKVGQINRSTISEVRFDSLVGYSLILEPKGTQVRLGEDKFETKLRRFKAIKNHFQEGAKTLTLVDLVNPEQAVIKGSRKVNAG